MNDESAVLLYKNCPVREGIEIITNGNENLAKMMTPMVAFLGDACKSYEEAYCKVFVHAFVKLCNPWEQDGSDCVKTCPSISKAIPRKRIQSIINDLPIREFNSLRNKRSLKDSNGYSGNVLTLGPIFLNDKVPKKKLTTVTRKEIVLLALAVVFPICLLILLIAAYLTRRSDH